MKYDIIRTDAAEEDLTALIHFIAEDSRSVQTALNYLDKLEKAVMNLATFPDIGVIPRYKSLKLQGFKVLIVENHLVFYRVNNEKKQVIVCRIIHGKQDYLNLI